MKSARELAEGVRLRSYGTFDGEVVVRDRIKAAITEAQQDAVASQKDEVEKTRGAAAAMREALLDVRRNHAGMYHGDGCPARGHQWDNCECPGTTINDEEPCVSGECECCLSTDAIAGALADDAGEALLRERDELRAAVERLRKALEWYADPERYVARQRVLYLPAEAEEDRGARARRALAGAAETKQTP